MTLINSKGEGLLVRIGRELFKERRSAFLLLDAEEARRVEGKWASRSSRPWSDLRASSPVCDLNLAESPELTGAAAAEGLDGSPA